MQPYLTPVSLAQRQVLALPNEAIETIYFPIDAVTSILALSAEGARIEVATVGNEGLVGLPVFLGAETSPAFAFAQVAGGAEAMSASVFAREAGLPGPFRDVLQRYTQAFLVRCPNPLSVINSTRPSSGSHAGCCRCRTGSLGLITYKRGRVTVLDRLALELAACACYRIVRDEFSRLLDRPFG